MTRFARPSILTFAFTLVLASLAWAQGPGVHGIDPSSGFQTLGTVEAVHTGFGSGMPILVVDDPTLGMLEVRLGPIWYLRDQGFSVAVGDEVELFAYSCPACASPVVAASITDLGTGATLELRDESGYPLWMGAGHGPVDPRCRNEGFGGEARVAGSHHGSGGGRGNGGGTGSGAGNGGGPDGGNGSDHRGAGPGGGEGAGPGSMGPGSPGAGSGQGHGWGGPGRHEDRGFGGQCGWTGPDVAAAVTASGTVRSVEVFGGSPPVLALGTPDGELELLLMPYGPIVSSGLLLEEGMELSVTYAPWEWDGETYLVVIALTDPASGVTIQLRDPETGLPLGGGHGRWGRR